MLLFQHSLIIKNDREYFIRHNLFRGAIYENKQAIYGTVCRLNF